MRTFTFLVMRRLDSLLRRLRLFFQRRLGPHGDLKVLSTVIAMIVFYLIRLTIGHPQTYRAPVHVSIQEQGVAILQYAPLDVEIELKGAADDVRAFDASELSVRLAIESTREAGGQVLKLTRRHVMGAGKLRVVRITPSEVFVEYDREVETTLRLSVPDLVGRPLQGEATIELLTQTVQVRGPESQLNNLVERSILLPTEPVDVSGRTQGFTRRVRVLPPDDSGISHVLPADVEVRVTITVVTPPESIYTNAPMPTATTRLPVPARADATNAPVGGEGGSPRAVDTPAPDGAREP